MSSPIALNLKVAVSAIMMPIESQTTPVPTVMPMRTTLDMPTQSMQRLLLPNPSGCDCESH
jgi:hypothetical protein